MTITSMIVSIYKLILSTMLVLQDVGVRPYDKPTGGGAFVFWFLALKTILIIVGAICAIMGTTRIAVRLYNNEDDALRAGGDLFLGMFFCVAIYGFLSTAFRI